MAVMSWRIGRGLACVVVSGAVLGSVAAPVALGAGSWHLERSGTPQPLNSVSFANADDGWAVGLGGTIGSTSTGGATWSAQASGTNVNLRGVSFIDPTHG